MKKQRFLMMISGAFVIFFTGYPHVWSLYQPYVMEQAGWSQSQTSMCFYLALAFFVIGSIVGGRIQDRKNPKLSIVIGGGIFSLGIILSSFLIIPSPFPIYFTYGILQGFGQGMIYTTILSTAQKWFPKRPGFASGVVITSNGLCGFFLAPISKLLLEKGGASLALFVIGAVIGISWIFSSFFFSVPVDERKDELVNRDNSLIEQKQYTSIEMMKTTKFYLLLVTMLFGLIPYFLLSPVSQTFLEEVGASVSVAVGAVMLGSICNAVMRLILPTLADQIGRIGCLRFVLSLEVVAMSILAFTNSSIVIIAVIVMYGCFGGIMGNFPSLTSSIFGLKHSGENYGYVMAGIIVATISSPMISNVIIGAGYNMQTVFKVGILFSVGAFVCLECLAKNLKR